ncbi:MAG: hypothetical protein A4E56_03452 [Pelotomaculum sp. PtaU1.Bin065]|nr:MAG: hypothetical protein A4E56_03452 [Pelotomaculum sp. PtaU1.Bin065]
MASPSRSGSEAINTWSAFFSATRKSLIVLPLPRIVIYFGLNPFDMSTPNWLLGKSRTCPMEALTIYFLPRNLLIVFAFAGDSTITKVFDKQHTSFYITWLLLPPIIAYF